MFRISNNNFKVLIKCKEFLNKIDKILENVPRRDMYYKDYLRNTCDNLLKYIFECSYELNKENIDYYFKKIKACIAQIDFMLDRLHDKKYIGDVALYRIGTDLVEVNKLVTGWLNALGNYESVNK